MTKKQAITITVLTISALALIITASERFWFRVDITGEKIYTISEVSRNLHYEIADQVHITYYLSDRLKAMHPLPAEIEDLLREYVTYSRGKIKLTVKDPAKTDLIEHMEKLGLIPQQIQAVEQDQTSIITVYTGIVIEYVDRVDILPFVFSPETLEYDLTAKIRALVRERPRLLGVITGDNPRRWNEDYRALQTVLAEAGLRLRLINYEDDIPDSIIALLVIGGVESFDSTVLYQIDRYIQTGGNILFAAKGIDIVWDSRMRNKVLNDNGLLEMLSSYGVTVLPEMVLDKSALPMQYQYRNPEGAVQLRVIRNPQWIRILGENNNHAHPASFRFGGLDMFYASPMLLNPPEGVFAEYLFSSTDEAWSMREPFIILPEIGELVWERDAEETRGKKILGASLTGFFPSWFSDKPKPSGQFGRELPDMPDEAEPARIIVVGDTDFISSNYLDMTAGQQNLGFIVQAVDWLSNDNDIIGIRNKETRSGRIDRILDPEKRTQAMRNVQILNVFIIPLLVVIAGLLLTLIRRAKIRGQAGES